MSDSSPPVLVESSGNSPESAADLASTPLKTRLIELLLVTLKIGATSFGAPTAHIAMMENEFVRNKKWVTEEHFLDLLSAANIIPGPNASETCYHVGYVRAGYPGLVVAGLGFIIPSFVSSVLLAWIYVHFGSLPAVTGLFYFLNPLVLAIVLETTWRIGKSSLKGWRQILILGLALAAKLIGVDEVLILLGAGLLGVFLNYTLEQWSSKGIPPAMMLTLMPIHWIKPFLSNPADWIHSQVLQIFLYFFKTGSVLFGSAMVLFALIQDDIVNKFQWLSIQQLIDSIAMGQITPGPVTSAATLIGYMVGGFWGSVASTVGVFLPSFIIVAITAPIISKMRENTITRFFLRGVNAAVVALILTVCYTLALNGILDIWTGLLFVIGLGVLILLKAQPYVLVLSGLVLGLVSTFLF